MRTLKNPGFGFKIALCWCKYFDARPIPFLGQNVTSRPNLQFNRWATDARGTLFFIGFRDGSSPIVWNGATYEPAFCKFYYGRTDPLPFVAARSNFPVIYHQTCSYCHKTGHFASVCKQVAKKIKEPPDLPSINSPYRIPGVHHIDGWNKKNTPKPFPRKA
ncbi:hypothetical protein P5673_026507 [Acropora cervicornis]|uniref:CCHC-type domain-containing protein n=1 Tax=Acropora cervicornis TaxID=6130 RepID=A0AAD9UWL8_ACRCE|nr:hypothetical protein P5673_026507 [Acropora cervicornis]